MHRHSQKLSILIPVFNEEKTILPLLNKIQAVSLPHITKELIVVDDGSTDQTSVFLRKLHHPSIRVFRHHRNQGKGAALRTAAAAVTGDFVLIQDADLEQDPNDYPNLLQPLLCEETDVVYGSRFLRPFPSVYKWSTLGNQFLNQIANHLYDTKFTDLLTGYKVFRREVFRQLSWKSNHFGFDAEITVQIIQKQFQVTEVSVSYQPRTISEGKKITMLDGFEAVFRLLQGKLRPLLPDHAVFPKS